MKRKIKKEHIGRYCSIKGLQLLKVFNPFVDQYYPFIIVDLPKKKKGDLIYYVDLVLDFNHSAQFRVKESAINKIQI